MNKKFYIVIALLFISVAFSAFYIILFCQSLEPLSTKTKDNPVNEFAVYNETQPFFVNNDLHQKQLLPNNEKIDELDK